MAKENREPVHAVGENPQGRKAAGARGQEELLALGQAHRLLIIQGHLLDEGYKLSGSSGAPDSKLIFMKTWVTPLCSSDRCATAVLIKTCSQVRWMIYQPREKV